MGATLNTAVVSALARRDLRMYFSSPSGYVFITLFIFLSAAAAFWQDRFFLDNLANLDQLNQVFPILLLLFIPALTMSVWSEERRLGTAELLFTLPATDLEIVLGKYFATLGIYTASLVLSLSHVAVLFVLGSPDVGLMLGNYIGFWLVGAALVPVGMLASLVTANATVAFILGAVFCGAVIFVDSVVASISVEAGRLLAPLSVFSPFWDFSKGVLTLSGLAMFLSVAGLFLYLNTLIAGRRHWPRHPGGFPMWAHQAIRVVAVAVVLAAVNMLVVRAAVRLDVTAEQLSSVSEETRQLLAALPEDRPVFIQAFLSPVVPELFVQARSNLIRTLEEIDALAGPKVEVLIEETEPFTDAAIRAREKFGIGPRQMRDLAGGRSEIVDVFLGVAFTSGAEQQVIPFFDRGLPTEYEVVRTIRVVVGSARQRVGVVDTMVKIFGGQNLASNQQLPQWSVVNELRKQYEVVEVNAEFPIPPDIDALLVALPSSMQTDQMTNVAEYIRQGRPAMLLVDPLPAVNPTLAPTEWVGEGNPFTYPPGSARPGPRGNVRQWMQDLGVDWEPTRIVWDGYNPHPDLSFMPSEVVFLGAGNENPETFNPGVDVVRDLQELVFLYPGFLRPLSGPDADPDVEFEPLLRTGAVSGQTGYFSIVQQSFFGPSINPNPIRQQDEEEFVVAARVRRAGPEPSEPSAAEESADEESADESVEEDEAVAEEVSETESAAEAEETGAEAAAPESAASAESEAEASAAEDASSAAEASAEPADPTVPDAPSETQPPTEPAAPAAPGQDSQPGTGTDAPVEGEAPGEPETPAEAEEPASPADAAGQDEAAALAGSAAPEPQLADPDAAAAPEADTAEREATAAAPEAAEPSDAAEADAIDIGEETGAEEDESGSPWTTEGPLNLVVVADLDFISEQFFAIREQAPGGLSFDNITFFLNAMDTLLEDDSFIELRSRRARHRTLERVEARTAEFIAQRTEDEQTAEADAEEALAEAQVRLNDRVAELQGRTDIDAQTKQIMVRNLEEVENRRLEVLSTNINTDKDTKIRAGREEMEAQIRQIQTSIKTFAILLPPVPVMLLGAWVFVRRQRREREGAVAAHRLRSDR
jgi:ABC-2 type transport system permease protein